ncbi:MAG: SIMPL domain-containing protein [Bacillota bacterium]|nr:SIMPL domain-containing protein [Bacillota bacterium]
MSRWSPHLIWAAVIVAVLALLGFNLGVTGQGGEEGRGEAAERGIFVTGEATVEVPPDRASVVLGVEADGKTAEEAQAKNAEAMQRVQTALRRLGIAEEQMRTSGFVLHPLRRWEKEGQTERLVGYRTSSRLTVTVAELDRLGSVLDAAVKAGATNVEGVDFYLSEAAARRDEALSKAVEDARHKAEVLSRAAGVHLRGVRAISDASFDVIQPLRYLAAAQEAGGAGGVETPLFPGTVRIKARVQMTFALEE